MKSKSKSGLDELGVKKKESDFGRDLKGREDEKNKEEGIERERGEAEATQSKSKIDR